MKTKIITLLLAGCALGANAQHYCDVKDYQSLKKFFEYSPERPVLISGHRGGMTDNYPENCIESFEKTLSLMPSFFEIDPRLTADSVIVLMHDGSLDRTSTGKGRVSHYTYAQLQEFNLVDRKGNITDCKIPTLDECITWSQGKTVLNLDIKDVPLETMAKFITDRAPANVIYTVWNPDQVLKMCSLDPNATFSIWCRKPEEFKAYEAAGIPWEKIMVAYVGPSMLPEHHEMYKGLHDKGVMCMISVAPTHDRCYNDGCKQAGYKMELNTEMRPDIIETDYPFLFE